MPLRLGSSEVLAGLLDHELPAYALTGCIAFALPCRDLEQGVTYFRCVGSGSITFSQLALPGDVEKVNAAECGTGAGRWERLVERRRLVHRRVVHHHADAFEVVVVPETCRRYGKWLCSDDKGHRGEVLDVNYLCR